MAGLGPPANRGSERANTRSWRLGGTEVGTAAQGTAPRCCSTSSGPATPTTIITPNRGRCFPSALDARDLWTRTKKSGGRLVDDAEEQEAISTMLAIVHSTPAAAWLPSSKGQAQRRS